MTTEKSEHHRSIRSFVLRQGRISTAQKRAYDDLLPHYGIAYGNEALDWDAVFGGERHSAFSK